MRIRVMFAKGNQMLVGPKVVAMVVFLAVFLTFAVGLKDAEAAITVDAVSSAARSSKGNSLTFSHTVGASGANRLLAVGVSIRHDDSNYTISVTYNGVAMMSSGRSSRKEALTEIFYLVAPATGTNNVVITVGKNLVFGAGATSFTGVDQTYPVGSFVSGNGDSTAPSVNVTSVNEGDVVIDTLATGDVQTATLTVGAGQTAQWNTTTTKTGKDQDTFVAGSTEPGPVGGGTVTMDWALSDKKKWALGALVIKPVGTGPTLCQSTVDAVTNATGSTASLSWAHTIGTGNARLLIVGVSNRDGNKTVNSVTYDGTNLTRIGFQNSEGNSARAEMWYLLAPPVGTATIAVSLSGSVAVAGGAISFFNVNQTAPLGTFASAGGKSATASVSVTSGVGELVLDTVAATGDAKTLTAASGQTAQWNTGTGTAGGDVRGAGSIKPRASSVTMSWTLGASKAWAIGAVSIKPSALSGTVYSDEGATNIGAGKTVRLIVNGTSIDTTTTDNAGQYCMATAFNIGDVGLVYIDDDGTYQGTTATVFGAAATLANFDVYAGHVLTRQDNSGALTNANLSTAKGPYSDTDILYSVASGVLTVEGNDTVLYTPTGHSFTPGGDVTTPNLTSLGTFSGGSSTIDVNGALSIIGGTFTASSGTIYVAGNLSISGATFNNNSGTMTFDGTDATINTGTATLSTMTVDKTNYTLTMASSLTVSGNLNVTSGILNQGASYDLTTGSVTIDTDGTFRNRGAGSLTLSGNVVNSGKIDFNGGGDDLCGSVAKALIRSSVNGTQRSWSGSGIFDMVDVDVKDQAGSASIMAYAGNDSGNNGTNWTFNAGCMDAPTAINLVSFTAKDHNGEILLQWRTGQEVGNLGFNVYREEGGGLERLTPELVAGSALRTGSSVSIRAGLSYAWLDILGGNTKGLEAKYWLEDVDLMGKRTWYGPVATELTTQPLPQLFTPQFLSELGHKVDDQYAEYWKIQELKKKLHRRKPVSHTKEAINSLQEGLMLPLHSTKRLSPSDVELQWAVANRNAVKIYIREEGWYRLSIAELKAAGLNLAHPKRLQLYADGKEIPILVKSQKPGRFDTQDTIEFYGTGVDSPYTDARVYWLTEGSRSEARVLTQEGKGKQMASASFPFSSQLHEHIFYVAALKNGDAENFFGAVVTTQPLDKVLMAFNLDPAPPESALLEVALQGLTDGSHRVKIMLNNVEIGDVVYEGQARGCRQLMFSQPLLLEGENLLTLVSQGGEMDVSLIDTVKLTYWHTYTTNTDSLKFSAQGGWKVSVGGFTSTNIRVVDITNPDEPYEVLGSSLTQGAEHSLIFGVPGEGLRTLLAFTDGKVKSPSQIVLNRPSQWHKVKNGHDLVIISHRDFLPRLEPLKKLRQSQRLRVALVDVEDLYDEFSFGHKTPQAIKDFLGSAKATWRRPPRFVLLVGDASFDPRNYLGVGDFDFVPTKLVETACLETASDDWFVDFNGDGLPESAIGRLPVRTAEETSTVVSKIIGYELSKNTGNWRRQALLVVDENEGFNFEAASEALRNLFPPHIVVRTLLRGQYESDEQAREELLRNLNQGALLVNYIGHGSEDAWGVDFFTSEDSQFLNNEMHLPFVVAMTCLNSYFHDIYTESLTEALLKAKHGGAVAVWGSSGLTDPNGQAVLNKELVRLLFSDKEQPLTLGEVLMRAKLVVTDQDIRRSWILFGDPTTRFLPGSPEAIKGTKEKRKVTTH